VFLLALADCRSENRGPVFTLSFDSSTRSSIRGSDFEPEYRGYLKRQALCLNPGNVLSYDVGKIDLSAGGTVEVWIKPGLQFPDSRIRLLRFFQFDLWLERSAV